jgi:hypothetical protein
MFFGLAFQNSILAVKPRLETFLLPSHSAMTNVGAPGTAVMLALFSL